MAVDKTIKCFKVIGHECDCLYCKIDIANLKKQYEELKMDEKELKLEVGIKYNIPHLLYNPYIYFGNKKIHGFNVLRPHTFIDNNGSTAVFCDEELENIQEHREPKRIVERSCDVWVTYDPSEEPSSEYIMDKITGFYTGSLYKTEEEVKLNVNSFSKYKKIHLTAKFEE